MSISRAVKPVAERKAGEGSGAASQKPERGESRRDLIEQIVVALILALIIRGFEAEAFVIPTGSMAPTLMGRHKEIQCPQCGIYYRLNAAGEVEGLGPHRRVAYGTCQNCRAPAVVLDEPSFRGDRILVNKFLYDLPFLPGGGGPDRWDVVVFRYPEEPSQNYIKRLVGLPNEELRVQGGDLLMRPLGSDQPFRFERRPLVHQMATQMLVWDDRHRPALFSSRPEWSRWVPLNEDQWDWSDRNASAESRFDARPTEGQWSELRYHNRVPDPVQWSSLIAGQPVPGPVRDTLITDFYAYNTSGDEGMERYDRFDWFQPHWVGDLTLELRITGATGAGELRLELVEGGTINRCTIDLKTGQAQLWHGEQQLGEPAATRLNNARSHTIVFANVDDRLTLWVDGRTPFGEGRSFRDEFQAREAPTLDDLSPARVALRGTTAQISDLVLKRDIYYTLDPGRSDFDFTQSGESIGRPYETFGRSSAQQVMSIFDALADVERFPQMVMLPYRDFAIRPGHFMMMGDNSPQSKDGRGWSTDDQIQVIPSADSMSFDAGDYLPGPRSQGPRVDELRELPRARWGELLGSDWATRGWDVNERESWEVPESLLIGKAFFVYWPHGVPVWPKIEFGGWILPFRPYFERMKTIR